MPAATHSAAPTAEPLNVLLVDDERLARKYLRELLSEQAGVSVIGEADSVAAAAELARQLRPDVIFLDVQMPPASGFDLLPLLDPAPVIVFVTAHDEFAVRAFTVSAADYLLKPVATDRLALALQHVRNRLNVPAIVPSESATPFALGLDDPLILRDSGRLRRVRARDIAALAGEGSYTRVYLSDERSMLVLRRMDAWETMLPAPPFLRAERSLIVNLERVDSLDIRSRDEGVLRLAADGAPARVLGRVALSRLRAALRM
ncbi:LytR/AlgR family response regulator transcription factor [Rariglobus hedericola]|uniref:Response regulator transcription factor n=1 Tax=Rariglobus hedericola TaxID=2597822 RepID=A0A556QN63_9BACT|nr:LytTR family DNA-binding domain-containing protein [Rariglobus hedericola]TSJ78067.1 response regulator transcription factor [Rariglobus hedericola]